MEYIAACIMHKNDIEALIENIKYHTLIGFDKIIIYDNESDVDLSVLHNYNNVILREWNDKEKYSQVRCYNHCIQNDKDNFQWIAFFDTDEFIVLKDGSTCIKQFMKKYENFAGLGINWKCFGSSGHLKKQESVIYSYIHSVRNKVNDHIKSIINPRCVNFAYNPHSFNYKGGFYCVNELFQNFTSEHGNAFNSPATHLKIQINHYITRSREDFQEKIKRGGGNSRDGTAGLSKTNLKLTEEFWNMFQNGEEENYIINLIEKISNTPVKVNKIFQIGFNRCGTTSLYSFFKENSFDSIHWNNGDLAKKMDSNSKKNQPLLQDIDNYQFYSDMEFISDSKIIEAYKMFQILDKQYTNSLFILNTRNKENWLKSRLQHQNGSSSYIKKYSSYYNLSTKEILEMWSIDWDIHHKKVRSYFQNNSRFLEFDIENDNPEKLFNFLKLNNIEIKSKNIEIKNASISH